MCQRRNFNRLPPGGGSAVRRWRSPRALHFRTNSRPCTGLIFHGRGGACSSRKSRTNSLSLPERGFINFSLFERKVTKEANQRAVGSPLRKSCRPRKFRPHLTQKFSVQMGCHRGISAPPLGDFVPRSAAGRTRSPSRALRPARIFFFCRDRRPRLSVFGTRVLACGEDSSPSLP